MVNRLDSVHGGGGHSALEAAGLPPKTSVPVKSSEVVQLAVDGKGPKEVAASLGVSVSLLYKWSEGKTGNPLDRTLDLLQATGSTAPLSWLCSQLGGTFLPRPDPAHVDDARLVGETQRMLKEFSDVLQAMTSAFLDGHVSAAEASLIRREWEELLPIAEGLVRACEQHASGASGAAKVVARS